LASLDGKNHCEQALFQAKNEQKLIIFEKTATSSKLVVLIYSYQKNVHKDFLC